MNKKILKILLALCLRMFIVLTLDMLGYYFNPLK